MSQEITALAIVASLVTVVLGPLVLILGRLTKALIDALRAQQAAIGRQTDVLNELRLATSQHGSALLQLERVLERHLATEEATNREMLATMAEIRATFARNEEVQRAIVAMGTSEIAELRGMLASLTTTLDEAQDAAVNAQAPNGVHHT